MLLTTVLLLLFLHTILAAVSVSASSPISGVAVGDADPPVWACNEVSMCAASRYAIRVPYNMSSVYECCPDGSLPDCEVWYPPTNCICPPSTSLCSGCYSLSLTNWTSCNATCGGGVSTRSVRCATEGNYELPLEYCADPLVYLSATDCNTFACTPSSPSSGYVWYADPWRPCDAFNGCLNFRDVWCLNAENNQKVSSTLCDSAVEPPNNKSCLNSTESVGGASNLLSSDICTIPSETCGSLPAQNATGLAPYEMYVESSWTGIYVINVTCDPTQCCCPSPNATHMVQSDSPNIVLITMPIIGVNCSDTVFRDAYTAPVSPVISIRLGLRTYIVQHNKTSNTLTGLPLDDSLLPSSSVCGWTLERIGDAPPITNDDDSGLTTTQKIGIIVGTVGGAILLCGAFYCVWKHKKERTAESQRLLKSTSPN